MPAQKRPRSHQKHASRRARQVARCGCKQGSINRPEFRPHDLPAQDLELVAQHQQLDVFDIQAPTATNKRAEQRPQGEVEKRESHAADTPSPRPRERRHQYWRPSPLAEIFARAVTDGIYRFLLPGLAGPHRLVPLRSLADSLLSGNAVAVAAKRGRLRAVRRTDQWYSTRQWVQEYKDSRYKRS